MHLSHDKEAAARTALAEINKALYACGEPRISEELKEHAINVCWEAVKRHHALFVELAPAAGALAARLGEAFPVTEYEAEWRGERRATYCAAHDQVRVLQILLGVTEEEALQDFIRHSTGPK